MTADPIASVRRLLYRRLRVRPGPEGVRQRPVALPLTCCCPCMSRLCYVTAECSGAIFRALTSRATSFWDRHTSRWLPALARSRSDTWAWCSFLMSNKQKSNCRQVYVVLLAQQGAGIHCSGLVAQISSRDGKHGHFGKCCMLQPWSSSGSPHRQTQLHGPLPSSSSTRHS